jgi:hypothetical protein
MLQMQKGKQTRQGSAVTEKKDKVPQNWRADPKVFCCFFAD